MSSRGQRPRKGRPPHPFPLSPQAGRGAPTAGRGDIVRGFHPRLVRLRAHTISEVEVLTELT